MIVCKVTKFCSEYNQISQFKKKVLYLWNTRWTNPFPLFQDSGHHWWLLIGSRRSRFGMKERADHYTCFHHNKKVGYPARWHSRSLWVRRESAFSSIYLRPPHYLPPSLRAVPRGLYVFEGTASIVAMTLVCLGNISLLNANQPRLWTPTKTKEKIWLKCVNQMIEWEAH